MQQLRQSRYPLLPRIVRRRRVRPRRDKARAREPASGGACNDRPKAHSDCPSWRPSTAPPNKQSLCRLCFPICLLRLLVSSFNPKSDTDLTQDQPVSRDPLSYPLGSISSCDGVAAASCCPRRPILATLMPPFLPHLSDGTGDGGQVQGGWDKVCLSPPGPTLLPDPGAPLLPAPDRDLASPSSSPNKHKRRT